MLCTSHINRSNFQKSVIVFRNVLMILLLCLIKRKKGLKVHKILRLLLRNTTQRDNLILNYAKYTKPCNNPLLEQRILEQIWCNTRWKSNVEVDDFSKNIVHRILTYYGTSLTRPTFFMIILYAKSIRNFWILRMYKIDISRTIAHRENWKS